MASGDKGIQIGYDNGTDQGYVRAIHAGIAEKQLTLNAASSLVAVAGNLTVVGALSKGSGSFLIDHPLDPDNKSLGHGFVEAPRYDLIYRGRATLEAGAAQVSIDAASNMTAGTWAALCRSAQVFVSNNEGWTPVRGRVDEATGALTIEAQDAACTDTVDWLVVAERNDAWIYEDPFTDDDGHYVPEHDKPDDARTGDPFTLTARGQRKHPKAQARKLAAQRLRAKKVR